MNALLALVLALLCAAARGADSGALPLERLHNGDLGGLLAVEATLGG